METHDAKEKPYWYEKYRVKKFSERYREDRMELVAEILRARKIDPHEEMENPDPIRACHLTSLWLASKLSAPTTWARTPS